MIVHNMQDGTTKDSVQGVVIQSKEFYQVLNAIQQRKRSNT